MNWDKETITKNFLNGSLFNNKHLPRELIIEMLFHLDNETLVTCQNVCHQWRTLIHNVLWHKKAEIVFQKVPFREDVSWRVYYAMSKMVFGRNLMKNHSGSRKLKFWTTIDPKCNCWLTERVPYSIAGLPNDPVFEGENYCFISRDFQDHKFQDINISREGFSFEFMDVFQPPIEISVYYCCSDELSEYSLQIYLFDEDWDTVSKLQATFTCKENESKQWILLNYVFKNYGPGVRKIRFSDSGYNMCRIAGASVRILTPERVPDNFADGFQ